MIYKYGEKKIRIPDDILQISMAQLGLTQEEAIQMYLEDEGIIENAEQEALEEKAKKNRITATIHQARAESAKKSQKERVRKADPTKEGVIAELAECLRTMGAEDVQIINIGKLITFKMGEDIYKLDLIRQRPKKEK